MGLGGLIKVTIPNYLSGLPIPDTVGGWFKLGFKDWLQLVPPTAFAAGCGYVAYRAFCPHGRPEPSGKVNLTIKKGTDKVVDTVAIEDIADMAAFCRCWRSKKFPYCDGSHNKHNTDIGDNVGPVVVKHGK